MNRIDTPPAAIHRGPTGFAPAAPAALPDDLREWFSQPELLRLALAAVSDVDPARFGARGDFGPEPRYSVPMLCTLLSYCYVTGRYASEDIEAALGRDPTLRYLCAGRYPAWPVLRRFRRVHRGLLTACLGRLIRRAWESRGRSVPEAAGGADALPTRAVALGEELLQRAVLADTMAADV